MIAMCRYVQSLSSSCTHCRIVCTNSKQQTEYSTKLKPFYGTSMINHNIYDQLNEWRYESLFADEVGTPSTRILFTDEGVLIPSTRISGNTSRSRTTTPSLKGTTLQSNSLLDNSSPKDRHSPRVHVPRQLNPWCLAKSDRSCAFVGGMLRMDVQDSVAYWSDIWGLLNVLW